MITDEEIKKVAKLIKIKLTGEELYQMSKEVSKILDFAEQLSEVDCDNLELNLGGTIETMYERKDAVTDGSIPDKILSNAPNKKYGMFSVPKIVE